MRVCEVKNLEKHDMNDLKKSLKESCMEMVTSFSILQLLMEVIGKYDVY